MDLNFFDMRYCFHYIDFFFQYSHIVEHNKNYTELKLKINTFDTNLTLVRELFLLQSFSPVARCLSRKDKGANLASVYYHKFIKTCEWLLLFYSMTGAKNYFIKSTKESFPRNEKGMSYGLAYAIYYDHLFKVLEY